MKRVPSFAVLLTLCLVLTTALNLSAQPLVRVGAMFIAANAPLFLAQDKGLFAQEGLKVEFIRVRGGAEAIPAIIGGSMEIGFSSYDTIILANAQGLEFKIVASNHHENAYGNPDPAFGYGASGALLVKKETDIKKAKDLEGKKVAVNVLNSIIQFNAKVWMEKKGADPKKVYWLEVPIPALGPALDGGKVDAIYQLEPFTTMMKLRGDVRVIDYPAAVVRPNMIMAGYGASLSYIQKHPDVLEKWARAHKSAIERLKARPEELTDMLVKYIKIPPEIISRMTLPLWRTGIEMEELQWLADYMLEHGALKRKLNVEGIVYATAR